MHFFCLSTGLFSLHHFQYCPGTPSTEAWPSYFFNSRICTVDLILQSSKLWLTPAPGRKEQRMRDLLEALDPFLWRRGTDPAPWDRHSELLGSPLPFPKQTGVPPVQNQSGLCRVAESPSSDSGCWCRHSFHSVRER